MKKIAIIGAGPMGLAVAYQLARDGYTPIIYEADDRIGGMAASFNFNGLSIERYYHFHCVSDYAFFKILAELDLLDRFHWVKTKMGFWYHNKLQPWGNPIALIQFKGLSFFSKFRYGLHVFLCSKTTDWKSLDKMTAVNWIKRWVGSEAYEVLWHSLFQFKFYQYTNSLSAAWIWSRIRRIGNSRYNLFNEKLGYLDGGSDVLLQAMQNDILKNGGQIKLQLPVKKVLIRNNKVIGIISDNGVDYFDTIISTIPLSYIPSLIPDLPEYILNQFKSVHNIAVVCVIIKLNKKVSDNFWININDPDMDIPGLVEYSNLRKLDNHIVYVPFYMPGNHKKYNDDNSIFISKVKIYLRKINPKIIETDFIDIVVSRYRFAQPIGIPEYLKSIPPARLPVEGLWVADTSYYYPEDRGISESILLGRNLAIETTSI